MILHADTFINAVTHPANILKKNQKESVLHIVQKCAYIVYHVHEELQQSKVFTLHMGTEIIKLKQREWQSRKNS